MAKVKSTTGKAGKAGKEDKSLDEAEKAGKHLETMEGKGGTPELEIKENMGDTPMPLSVALVTPQKLVIASKHTESDDESARQFYIINKATHAYIKQESKKIAMEYFGAMVKVCPELAENLVVQDFESDESMKAFIGALMMMSGKNPVSV
jgi:hypothetical protein